MNHEDPPSKQQIQKQEKEFRKNMSVTTIMAIPFLALNHYDGLFMLVYMFIAIGLLAYKNIIYPFPGYALACEGIILTMLSLTQLLRYKLASKTVTDRQTNYAIIYLVGSVFVMLSLIFQLRLQTYVVLAQIITNSIGIALIVLEMICAIWILIVVQRKKRNR